MADSRHFENSFVHISAVNYPISIKFGMQMRISILKTEIWQKNRNFANSRERTDAILKIIFGCISATYWPINAKFGPEMKNHMQI